VNVTVPAAALKPRVMRLLRSAGRATVPELAAAVGETGRGGRQRVWSAVALLARAGVVRPGGFVRGPGNRRPARAWEWNG
jgi:hypothetical protein